MKSATNNRIDIFKTQQKKAFELRLSTPNERISKLKAVRDWTLNNEALIAEAIYKDFKKSDAEVHMSEIMPVISEANFIIKNLKSWMRARTVAVPMMFLGTKNKVAPQPKGNSLIISPWNYPFVLAVKPILSAIAAGCTVVLKPSELTPNTSSILNRMISEIFNEDEGKVFEGDAQVAIELQNLPFNHVFFTGSPAVGKMVMAAASKHLSSVTLELGGKSPSIVDETANLKEAASKVAFGNFLNAGQTCIAPDYVFVHKSKKDAFIQALINAFNTQSKNDFENNSDFCRIVNQNHFDRINGLVDGALKNGAKLEYGGDKNKKDCFLHPMILSNIDFKMEIMQQEIFGPVIPIVTFDNITEVSDYINSHEKPLALYMFSKSNKNKRFIEKNTASGAIVHGDFGIQYIYHGIAFGGINNSGMGYAGGKQGFLEFSHLKPIISNVFSATNIFQPPYTEITRKLMKITSKYFS